MIKGINTESGRTDRLISFVDLAPTMLSLAGVNPAEYMEGQAFLGDFDTDKRTYVFGSSDRFDEYTDRIRALRNKQFLYLRNDYPELLKYKDVAYRKNIEMMPVFLNLKDEHKLNSIQNLWFQTKTKEELYDCEKDPHNINNLAEDPAYAYVLTEMREALEGHLKNRNDYGLIPESEMVKTMWPDFEQPITNSVSLNAVDISEGKKIALSTKTKGASIAYIISNQPDQKFDFNSGWKLYTEPVALEKGQTLYAIAQRIGFRESEIVSQTY
jgi:hypothetical protein